MFYSLKKDSYFKKYDKIGYIVHPILSIDEVVNQTGALFLAQLDYSFQDVNVIVEKLSSFFDLVDIKDLTDDAISFYDHLYNFGFVNRCDNPDTFVEPAMETFTLRELSHMNKISMNSTTSDFFFNYVKENPILTSLHIELTNKCNERCIHCFIPHETKNNQIDYNMAMDIIEQCKNIGVVTLLFSGGEPMCHPNFCEFLKKAKDYDMNVIVLSNLTLLNDKIIETLMYKHTTCVRVSLYSMDANIHDSITMLKGSFQKTKNNILKLIEKNVPVQINCPIMKQNKDTFSEVMQWGKQHKCNVTVDFSMIARQDGSTGNLENRLSTEELKNVIKIMIDNYADMQEDVTNNNEEIPKQRDLDDCICGVGLTIMAVDSKGNISPCVGWQKCICGNVKENLLKDVWIHSKELNYLRKLRFRDFKKCITCEDAQYCNMCMNMNANESSDGNVFDIPQITCDAARIQHKVIEEYKKTN